MFPLARTHLRRVDPLPKQKALPGARADMEVRVFHGGGMKRESAQTPVDRPRVGIALRHEHTRNEGAVAS